MQHTNWNRRPTSTEALSDKLMSRSLSVALAGHCVRHFEFDEASHHTILWEPTHGKSRRRAPCIYELCHSTQKGYWPVMTKRLRSELPCCVERPGVEWPVARPVELSWAVPPAPRPIIIKLGLVGECLLYRRLETDNILDHFRTFLSSIMTWLKRSSGPGYIN